MFTLISDLGTIIAVAVSWKIKIYIIYLCWQSNGYNCTVTATRTGSSGLSRRTRQYFNFLISNHNINYNDVIIRICQIVQLNETDLQLKGTLVFARNKNKSHVNASKLIFSK